MHSRRWSGLPRRNVPPADATRSRTSVRQADTVSAAPLPGAPDPLAQVAERVREITRQNERLFAELIAGERRFRGLARSVWAVQEAERRRLARELHDGIGQTLTALKQQLEVVEHTSAADLPDPARARLRDATELAAQALRETRELSRLLRPQILDDLGLEPALTWMTRTFGERTGIALEVTLAGLETRLPAELETLAYRLVQEALNNIAKHAQARQVRIEARCAGGWLTLLVGDDGRGFDPGSPTGDGSGLRGMRDRVELFGGRIDIDARPGGGTRISARVPCATEAVTS
jgi:two-component system NarL family sensor kinase